MPLVEAGATRYRLGATCSTCGTVWKAHPTCSACGTALGGLPHESATPEPFGENPVCEGCRRHLTQRGLRIARPASPNHEVVLAEARS